FGQRVHVDHVVADTPARDHSQPVDAVQTLRRDSQSQREDGVELVKRVRRSELVRLRRHGGGFDAASAAHLLLQHAFEFAFCFRVEVGRDPDAELWIHQYSEDHSSWRPRQGPLHRTTRFRVLNSNIVQLSRRRFAATLAGSLGAARLAAVPTRPKLCVLLVAEQFRSDYLSQFAGLLGTGGFRRLMEEGAFLPDCRMASSSFSASGLATIATGAYPEAHGIVAESWYDAASKKVVPASASLNQADTLGDQVAGRGGRVFAAAMNRTHAELLVRGAPSSRTR